MRVGDELVEFGRPEPVDLGLQPLQPARHDPVDPCAPDLLRPHQPGVGEQQRELARRFFAAAEQGDLAGLEALLAHDVTLTGDGGGKVPALARSQHGRSRVAHTLTTWLRALARFPQVSMRPTEINGGPGAIYYDDQDRVLGVWALDISDGQVTGIRSIVNPDKLAHLGPVGDAVAILREAR